MYTRKPWCGRETARSRCKIRYVSKFTADRAVLRAITRLLFILMKLWYFGGLHFMDLFIYAYCLYTVDVRQSHLSKLSNHFRHRNAASIIISC